MIHATLNGKELRVAGLLTPLEAQMMLVVLDITGDLTLADPAKSAVVESLGQLPASTYAAILRAQDGLKVLRDPTADREETGSAVRDLPISGRPGLIEVLEPVQRMADSIARKARVRLGVIYVTDSDVTLYREDFTNPVINSSDPHDLSRRFPEALIQEKISKLATLLAPRETPMQMVHLVERVDRLNEAYQNGLRRLAEAGGGGFSVCRTTADIPEAIHAAFRAAASEYEATLELPDRAPAAGLLRMWAADERGKEIPLLYRARISLKEKK